METIELNGKQYQLDIEKAKEFGLLTVKTNDFDTPTTWEEYENFGKIPLNNDYAGSDYNVDDNLAYDIFADEKTAKAFCALGKLVQLRDCWVKGFEEKHCIYSIITQNNLETEIVISAESYDPRRLSFPTGDMACDFRDCFKELILEAQMFLK